MKLNSQPSLPQQTKTQSNIFGFGLKVSKEPILPRIFSHQQIKHKKTEQSTPIMAKRNLKPNYPTLEPLHSQPISLDHSPSRLVLIMKNGKIEKTNSCVRRRTEVDRREVEQYEHLVEKYQEIMFKSSEKQSSKYCLEFPNKIHKLDKLTRIHRTPKRNISDRHYEQIRRHNMLVQRNLESTKQKILDIEAKKFEERISETEKIILNRTPRKRETSLQQKQANREKQIEKQKQRLERLKKQKQQIFFQKANKLNVKVRGNLNSVMNEEKRGELIDRYQNQKGNDDEELEEYMEREKSVKVMKNVGEMEYSNVLGHRCMTESVQ